MGKEESYFLCGGFILMWLLFFIEVFKFECVSGKVVFNLSLFTLRK